MKCRYFKKKRLIKKLEKLKSRNKDAYSLVIKVDLNILQRYDLLVKHLNNQEAYHKAIMKLKYNK